MDFPRVEFLLGFYEGKVRVEIPVSLCFLFFYFCVLPQIANRSLTHMPHCLRCTLRATNTKSIWHDVMAHQAKFLQPKVKAKILSNTLKAHTKHAQYRSLLRSTLKDVERFRNGSVQDLYERST